MIDRAQITLGSGPLAVPAACRLAVAVAGLAGLPVDRLEDIEAVVDLLAERARGGASDGRALVELRARPSVVDVTVGPLGPADARALSDPDCELGAILAAMTDAVEVDAAQDGGRVRARLGAGSS